MSDGIKKENPKDSVGTGKVPVSTIPAPVIAEVGLAMLEGARKYGRHNFRIAGVRASIYYDAVVSRHLPAWWEGQDEDPDTCTLDADGNPIPGTGLSHITKAIAALVVLRDAMMNQMWVDDRPPPFRDPNWVASMNEKARNIIARYPDAAEPFTRERLERDASEKRTVQR